MRDRPSASLKMGPGPVAGANQPPAPPPPPQQPVPAPAATPPIPANKNPQNGGTKQAEYDRLMQLVEQLRRQFPEKSEAEILDLAQKIIAKENEDRDMWAGVASKYGANGKVMPPRPHSVPPLRDNGPSASAANPQDPKPYMYGGVPGAWVPNPEFGRKHGLIWDGKGWQDGSMQNQAVAAQQSEQQYLAQKRQIELERLRMEMELDRLQKKREMAQIERTSPLGGLGAQYDPLSELTRQGPGKWYY